MNLKQFFGEWEEGTYLIASGHIDGQQVRLFTQVKSLSAQQVVLTPVEGQKGLGFEINSTKEDDRYDVSFTLDECILPGCLSGSNIKATYLVGPPAPISMYLQGKMTQYSNTLLMEETAVINLRQVYEQPYSSQIIIENLHPIKGNIFLSLNQFIPLSNS